MIDIKQFVRHNILSLKPYSTARDEYHGEPLEVYLDANESPWDSGFNRYPDPAQKLLKLRLSEIKGLPMDHIFVGNGSDEAIDHCFRVFCEPGIDNVVSIAPTYGMYKVAAAINNVEFRECALGGDNFAFSVEKLLAMSDAHTKLIFVCSPNNPTGGSLGRGEIIKLLKAFHGIVVVDEAYIDFSSEKSLSSELVNYPNLIVLQTLSKAWGMASLRLGLALACPEIIRIFGQVKYPYNINSLAQQTVLSRLSIDISKQIEIVVHERDMLYDYLSKSPKIIKVYPSDSNFLLVRVPRPRELYNQLIAGGIIVRDRSGVVGCEGCLRITVGTPEQNVRLMEIMR